MLPRPEVTAQLGDFVAVELFTDVPPDGDRYRDLEQRLFQTVALPYYAVITPDGKQPLAQRAGMERNEAAFLKFLKEGRQAAARAAENQQLTQAP